jgi:hypothetical protein
MEELIKNFCDRKYLKRKHPSLEIGQCEKTNREFIYIDDLMIIVRFLGYVKFEYNRPKSRNHIFMRGQTEDFGTMIPSIFRGKDITAGRIQSRLAAYQKVKQRLGEINSAERFKGEIGGASLQHYGLKTPWLDLVDNIFIALWFARNEMIWIENNSCKIEKSEKEFGWIYLLKADYEQIVNDEGIYQGINTQWCDLRYHHRDLSLRPHFQHGIFITKSNYSESNFDLNNEIVATIKFPIRLKNDIKDVKPKQMFPEKSYDNTYKYLTKPKINHMICDVEKEWELDKEELGRIFTVN